MILSRIKIVFLPLILTVLVTCSEHEVTVRSYPVADTKEVTEITENGVILNGEILSPGSSGISDHGFVYGRFDKVTLKNGDVISLGEKSGKGTFSSAANRNLVKGETYFVRAYAIDRNKTTTVYGEAIEFRSKGSSPPELDEFTPTTATIGDTIIITGSGFSNNVLNNRVTFKSIPAPVVSSRSDLMKVLVPNGLDPGEAQISVEVGSYTVKSDVKFILVPIKVLSISPDKATFGDEVTITGENFPDDHVTLSVLGFDKMLPVRSRSRTTIKVAVPDDVSQFESLLEVKSGVQTAGSPGKLQLLLPVIESVTPEKMIIGGTVTINGKNFSPVKANNVLEVGTTAVDITEASSTLLKGQLKAAVPPGKYPVKVLVLGRGSNEDLQVEILKPEILQVSPLNGTWGSTVRLRGVHFGASPADNIVKFNNVQATILNATATEIEVVVPDNLLVPEANVSVQVLPSENPVAVFETPYTLDPPEISTFSPLEGKVNELVTIQGVNFHPIQSNNVVTFGGVPVQIVSVSASSITVRLPSKQARQEVEIKVTIAGRSASANQLFSQLSPWRRLGDYPGNAKRDAVAFVDAEYGYVGLGTQVSIQTPKQVHRYNHYNDTWTQVRPFSFYSWGTLGAYGNQVSFFVNNEVYVGMGNLSDDWFGLQDMSKYTPETDRWGEGTQAPIGLTGTVSYSINNKGYVITGVSKVYSGLSKVLEFDPVAGIWSEKAPFPGPGLAKATGFSIGEHAYLVTGYGLATSYVYSKDMWRYNTNDDSWLQMPSLPADGRWQASAFAIDGIGYIVGGTKTFSGADFLSDFWSFDPSSNEWKRLDDFPGEPRAAAVVFVRDGKAYYGTGITFGKYLKDFWEFDPSKL